MNNKLITINEADDKRADEWRYGHLVTAVIAASILQFLLLPCLCQIGIAKIRFAVIFDGLMLMRMAFAAYFRERGKGWIFYTILTYTSPFWIELGSWPVFGH